MLSKAPLFAGSLVLVDMKKWPPAQLLCLQFAEVGSVAVYDEYHVARLVGYDCILMAGCIVEKEFGVVHGFFGGFGLR